MKKKHFLILFLIIISLSSFSQNGYFNNVYPSINTKRQTEAFSATKDGDYYVVASPSVDTSSNVIVNFSRFDNNGNLIVSKNFGQPNQNFYPGRQGNFHKIYDGNFIISGGIQNLADSANGFLLKLTPDFDTIFIRKYYDPIYHYLEFQQMKPTNDNGFIIVGGKNGAGSYNEDILVIKTDNMGNEKWRKVIDQGGIDYARNVIQTPDNGYLLGAYSYIGGDWNSGDDKIIKLDSVGNTQWIKTIGGSHVDGIAFVALANDSNFIVATSIADSSIPYNEGNFLNPYVLKLNKNNGDTIWSKKYITDSIGFQNYVAMLKVAEDGEIFIVGVIGNYKSNSWFLRLNSNGDSLTYKPFYYYDPIDINTGCNFAMDFCLNSNNSMVICGYASLETAVSNIWLVGMDKMGCMQIGCAPTGIEEPRLTKLETIRVYPNPTTMQTTIAYPQLKEEGDIYIYSMLGQMVYKEKLAKGSSQTNLNIQNYKAGLYKVIIREMGMIKGQVSLVKE